MKRREEKERLVGERKSEEVEKKTEDRTGLKKAESDKKRRKRDKKGKIGRV